MQSIVSTFVGILFPSTLVIDTLAEEVYFQLYESYFARYTVKLICEKSLAEETFREYNDSWTLQNITQEQVPLMVVATGVMKQQAILSAFLGTVVEEKFHMSPLSMSILPCKPFIRDSLRPMIVDHPDLAPIRFGRGCKEGFFIVNLSAEQDFTEEPAEFREMGNQTNARSNDGRMEDFEEAIVEGGQNTMHNDEDEIQNETNNRPAQGAPRQRNFDDFEAEEVVESATEAFVRTMGARRFSDCSNEDSEDP